MGSSAEEIGNRSPRNTRPGSQGTMPTYDCHHTSEVPDHAMKADHLGAIAFQHKLANLPLTHLGEEVSYLSRPHSLLSQPSSELQ